VSVAAVTNQSRHLHATFVSTEPETCIDDCRLRNRTFYSLKFFLVPSLVSKPDHFDQHGQIKCYHHPYTIFPSIIVLVIFEPVFGSQWNTTTKNPRINFNL
ncbi:hypothetical protein K0M31_007559, partial [Melipona bicolor]